VAEFASTIPVPRSIARKKIIITGGCGFIGHHVVEHFAKTTDCNLVVIDKLSYASLGRAWQIMPATSSSSFQTLDYRPSFLSNGIT
jgi:dTDP-D-glucose 4,6-dehydratase